MTALLPKDKEYFSAKIDTKGVVWKLDKMILIKLGGSIITNKGKPESARRKTIDNILKQIKKINEPTDFSSWRRFVRSLLVCEIRHAHKTSKIQLERTLSSKKLHDRTGQNYLGQCSEKQVKHILSTTY